MNTLTLNLYKAFGIRKEYHNLYSVGTELFYKTPRRFKSPRGAMTYAIKHARQGDAKHAYIYHPQGGVNRLSIHPQTGNLTMHHVAHSDDENKRPPGQVWTERNLSQRDTLAFNRMKHLHKNSLLSLGDTPMDISTEGLHNLPEE